MTKITQILNDGDVVGEGHFQQIKDVVNINDDIATPLEVAYSTTVKADRTRFLTGRHDMTGPVAITLDVGSAQTQDEAIPGLGQTLWFLGDGNNITVSGGTIAPAQHATIATEAGVELLLVFVYSGSYWQIGIEGANSTTSSYTFANTHELLVDADGEGVTILNDACYPSDGAGTDKAFSLAIKYKTPATIGALKTFLTAKVTTPTHSLFTVSREADDSIQVQFLTDVSNTLRKRSDAATDKLIANTVHNIVITKAAGETWADVKIYLDGSEVAYDADGSTGTYAGMPAKTGTLKLDIGNSQGVAHCPGFYRIFDQFNAELTAAEVTELQTSFNLSTALQAKCVQESLLNGNANADNIGNDGTTEGTATYQVII